MDASAAGSAERWAAVKVVLDVGGVVSGSAWRRKGRWARRVPGIALRGGAARAAADGRVPASV